MIEIGRLCVKIAGRDAGRKCVVIDILDDKFVLIDGATRRRKCNIAHIEPLEQTLNIKKGASHADVIAEFKKLSLPFRETKPKAKKVRPRTLRRSKLATKPAVEKKPKTTAKKEEKPKEEAKEKKTLKKKKAVKKEEKVETTE